MSTFERWKEGWGIIGRFFMLGLYLTLVTIPLRFLEFLDDAGMTGGWLTGSISVLYLLVVVPIALPAGLRNSGLVTRNIGLYDKGGSLNEAARLKQTQLDAEPKPHQQKGESGA